jgi:hypothetical protein
MIAIIEKGVLGDRDGLPIYSIMIDEETDSEVNFMAMVQIDGTMNDLVDDLDINPELLKQLENLPMFGSLEVELKIGLDVPK